ALLISKLQAARVSFISSSSLKILGLQNKGWRNLKRGERLQHGLFCDEVIFGNEIKDKTVFKTF
ncbi:hypothetical protein ACMXZD_10240, partial [Pasteurella multocida]